MRWSAVQCSVCTLQCVHREVNLLTLQPHTRRLQCLTSRQTRPVKVPTIIVADSVHSTLVATVVPESAAAPRCTVCWPPVVVAVIRGEHPTVMVAECIIAGVTRVPSHLQRVAVCLGQYYERTVLGVVPVAVATWLQLKPQLIAVGRCQLTEPFVAEPVVAGWDAETDFKLRPWTIEEVRPVEILLDQHRAAVRYRTTPGSYNFCRNNVSSIW